FQAVSFAGSSNVKISGNLVHQIRQDGIRGYDTSNLTISDNYLTDFYKVGSEHADAIQIYTGSYGPAHHIRVVGNVITQGDGAEVQGIFIRDDSASLRNVEVSGNLVVGATLNGIALSGVNGLKVDANTVISRTGELSWLSVKTSPEAVVTNNEALRFILNGDMVENNNNLNITTGYDEAVVQAWLGSSTTANSFLDRLSDVPKTSGATAVTSAVSRTLLGSEEDLSLKGVANADGGGNGLDNALVGNSGNNRLFGAGGDDVIEGGAGDDVLDGGAGVDTASYEHAKGSVTVNLLKGFSKTYGAGQDTYRGVENVTGSAYSDTLSGDAGKNVLAGGGGSDRLIGNGGADTMTGGAGADMFFYNALNDSKATARDTILDFNRAAGDTIHLRNIDANANRPGDQAFTLVHGFTKVAGQLTVTLEVDHYAVRGDVNGDAIADFAINVHTGKSLLASDFVL
ncbi:right-handed parallel beta-helix repeat-containing protein, partial [uncultured Phenylobacterium sp.]|uniref:M10 family metallopeptidase C-terminal domain-containing protein n=1 Tax=uncultured Phenylobacterium sp. TaxID=349273 RepID=UPI0025E56B86